MNVDRLFAAVDDTSEFECVTEVLEGMLFIHIWDRDEDDDPSITLSFSAEQTAVIRRELAFSP